MRRGDYVVLAALLAVVLDASATSALAAPPGAEDPFAMLVRPTEPLSPADELKAFRLPEGFAVELVAAEPDIAKPLNLAFDARGRLWATVTTEYPHPAPADRPGRDRIVVIDVGDGDGKLERVTTFADELNIPMGIYPYGNGVIAFGIPHVWRLEDTDSDGKADRRERLYGPFGWERDTHGLNNAFRRGFDGWLYACHGFNNDTRVAGADGQSVHLNSGNTYRMRLDGSRIEQFTWGQVNPFGMCLDELGDFFTADCHTRPVYQLLRGGYYPSFGKPDDGLGFVPPMMEHLHGSTGIAGVVRYDAENFPPEYRGDLFVGNVVTSRVNRDRVIRHGSTLLAAEAPDFVSTNDPWFRPVDLAVGPDGALYIADFYNRIIGHYEVAIDHPGRDRHRGRIWRVTYRGADPSSRPATAPPDLSRAAVGDLIAAFSHPSLTYRQLALDELVDRRGAASAPALRRALDESPSSQARSRALWALHRLGVLGEGAMARAAGDPDPAVRVHAMKVLAETPSWSQAHRAAAREGLADRDPFVARAAADAAGRHPLAEDVHPLIELLRRVPADDPILHYTVRMALRNELREEGVLSRLNLDHFAAAERAWVADLCLAIPSAESAIFLLSHLEADASAPRAAEMLRHAARHAPATAFARIVDAAPRIGAADLDTEVELFGSVYKGIESRGADAPPEVRAWGADLARRLFRSCAEEASAWSHEPLAEYPGAESPWDLQQRAYADGVDGGPLLSSFPHGEKLTGILRSRLFPAPARLEIFVAGHDGFPEQPLRGTIFVRLRSAAGVIVAEAAPPRNDIAQRVAWDLGQHAGSSVRLEIVDGNDADAYAWIAVGRIEPAVLPPLRLGPRRTAARQRAAAAIVEHLKLRDSLPELEALLAASGADPSVEEAAARSLLALDPDRFLTGCVPLLANASLPAELRATVRDSVRERSRGREALYGSLAAAVRVAPQRSQVLLAAALSSDTQGAEVLLTLVESGAASPRLLLRTGVKEKLAAAKPERLDERVALLTRELPPEKEAVAKLLEARKAGFLGEKRSEARGAEVFVRACAPCHQVAGKGVVIGPQLDGAGGRGLDRLIEDILDSNRNVDVAFRTTVLVLSDGQVLTGLLRRMEGETLVLADTKGQELAVAKGIVVQMTKSELSLMPDNFAEALPEAEFHDLIAYLLAQRPRDNKLAK